MAGRFRVLPDVRYRLVRREAVVLKQEEGETLVLNEVGSRVLQLLSDGSTIEEIVTRLGDEFEVGPEELSRDVETFAAELVEAGVVAPAVEE